MPTRRSTGINLKQRELFWRRMHALTSVGSPLLTSMQLAAGQASDTTLRNAVVKARDSIVKGTNMASSMREQKTVFSPTEVEFVRIGEKGGCLDVMFGKLADMICAGLLAPTWRTLPGLKPADAGPVKELNTTVSEAVKRRAREVRLVAGSGAKLNVTYVVGRTKARGTPIGPTASVISRLKIMTGMDIAEKRKPQKGSFMVRVDGKEARFEVTTVPSSKGEGCVLKAK
jgi:hypothetical protein